MLMMRDFQYQYQPQETVMRTKFAADFPQYDVAIFNAQYYGDRKRADGSGRQTRYSFDERRYMAEKATWQNFWPDEEFPGQRPLSDTEIIALENNGQQSNRPRHNPANQGRGQGRGRARGHRGRNNQISPTRGDTNFGGRVRSNSEGAARALRRYQGFGSASFNHSEHSSSDLQGEFVNFSDDTSTTQDLSSIISTYTQGTPLSISCDKNPSTIICRQCGITGHPELSCPYQITVKQGINQERHLVCGTFGHEAFRFASYHGCLECTKEKEKKREKSTENLASELQIRPSVEAQLGRQGATGAKDFALGSGWNEAPPSFDSLIPTTISGSFYETLTPFKRDALSGSGGLKFDEPQHDTFADGRTSGTSHENNTPTAKEAPQRSGWVEADEETPTLQKFSAGSQETLKLVTENNISSIGWEERDSDFHLGRSTPASTYQFPDSTVSGIKNFDIDAHIKVEWEAEPEDVGDELVVESEVGVINEQPLIQF